MLKLDLIKQWENRLQLRKEEIQAFKDIQREDFLPKEQRLLAYQDTPLPILRGKTISQPTTVMFMTSILDIQPNHVVLEVGSGSGYQTAILSKLVGKGIVHSTEVIPELVQFAKKNIKNAKIQNVKIYEEDGSKGLPHEAPFDRIIITAACKEFPKELLQQLKPGGIIVGPIGSKEEQEMVKGIKDKKEKLELHFLGQFIFSPLYGKYGFTI
jgi:protein-L-isoaspartate(D-aspartate) O-methyltransferase